MEHPDTISKEKFEARIKLARNEIAYLSSIAADVLPNTAREPLHAAHLKLNESLAALRISSLIPSQEGE